MNKTIPLLLFLILTYLSIGQENEKVFSPYEVATKATYKNGVTDIITYISENLKQPFICVLDRAQTTITIKFIIETDGSLSNITVTGCESTEACCKELSLTCKELLENMNGWTPATINGSLVRQHGQFPIHINNGN